MTEQPANTAIQQQVFVTCYGLPLAITLEWPFFRSKTGADFYVLHGTVHLADGSGLHALIALQLTVTLKEILPSLEPKDVEWAAINTIRKAVDTKEVEFTKNPKRIPLQFGSRSWDFKRGKWVFQHADESNIEEFFKRKVYWQTRLEGSGTRVWLADPTDAQYWEMTPDRLAGIAQKLAAQGLLQVNGEFATATPQLLAEAQSIEDSMKHAQHELEEKHAYERG
jgi:hypothetical protein